eukprot:1146790-Pelagomonas_calceolata.AAC.1
MATEVAVLLLGGLELIFMPGVFTVFDLHKMNVPLFRKKLARAPSGETTRGNIFRKTFIC